MLDVARSESEIKISGEIEIDVEVTDLKIYNFYFLNKYMIYIR